jgi:hypothetical protein
MKKTIDELLDGIAEPLDEEEWESLYSAPTQRRLATRVQTAVINGVEPVVIKQYLSDNAYSERKTAWIMHAAQHLWRERQAAGPEEEIEE